jgi:Zn-dependent protease with chaperone function
MINSAMIDRLDEQELLFVIGHECGHIHNRHVVFSTANYYLTNMASLFVRWIVTPAILALNTWSRRAEVTSDRAGLICCGDIDPAVRTMVKLALGSSKLMEQVNVEEFVSQLKEVKEGIGRVNELNQTHPYIPKRVAALRLFAESEYYKQTVLGVQGGLALTDVDAKVAEILSVT